MSPSGQPTWKGRERAELLEMGRSSADAYITQPQWIQRRVESMTFPHVEQRIVRRQTSFDVSCPPGLASYDDLDGRPTLLLPLSLVRRWPPHIRIDLTTGKDQPRTLPASRDADVLDAGLLIGLAMRIDGNVPGSVGDIIQVLTSSHSADGAASDDDRNKHPDARGNALAALVGDESEVVPAEISDALRHDDAFAGLARELMTNRVLWVPVTCEPGERCLIKLTYEVPLFPAHNWRHPSSWAWVGLKLGFDMPGIGRSRSSHFNIEFPGPLAVHHARLELSPPDTPRAKGNPTRQVFREVKAAEHALREGLVISERADHRHGSFYVESPKELQADAYVNAGVEKHGYIRGALIASSFVFLTLLFYRLGFTEIRGPHRTAAITVLLFVPGLLGLLVVRAGEHQLASTFLSGVRKLVVVNAGWPLIAAIALILDNQPEPATASSILGRLWAGLLAGSAISTGMLLASAYLPAHERWLDDIPKPRAVISAAVVGLAVGLVNGFLQAFWSGVLLMALAAALVLVVFAAYAWPRRSSALVKRQLWTIATLFAVAAVVGVLVDIIQKVAGDDGPQPQASTARIGAPMITAPSNEIELRTGIAGSCPIRGPKCEMKIIANRANGREVGSTIRSVAAGQSAEAIVPLAVRTNSRRTKVTVTVEVSRADIGPARISREFVVP